MFSSGIIAYISRKRENLMQIENILMDMSSFVIFKNFLSDNVCFKFINFIKTIKNEKNFTKAVEAYSDFISELYKSEYKGDWSSYIRNFVLSDENVISIECAKATSPSVPIYMENAFESELNILSEIASFSCEDVKNLFTDIFSQNERASYINNLPEFDSYKLLFTKEQIQNSYKTKGYGITRKYFAFKFNKECELVPVKNPDFILLKDLKLYEYQKNILKNNTLSFIKGDNANNVLLYGDRGCGKSSLVKAVANEYKKLGLKIIQIYKENLSEAEKLFDYLSRFSSKFILFADDLVFDENDPVFASSKAILEGTISKRPDNVLIYATTNRRHLVKETFKSREGDEIHMNDTMDEAASLSDRFGITITFSSPDKKNYLKIVKMLADEMEINYDEETLFSEAESFALLKGNRAPRIARQFLVDYKVNNKT